MAKGQSKCNADICSCRKKIALEVFMSWGDVFLLPFTAFVISKMVIVTVIMA